MSTETYVLQEMVEDTTKTKLVACGPLGYVLKAASSLVNNKKEKPALVLNKCEIDEEGSVLFTNLPLSVKTISTVEVAAQNHVA